MRQIFNTLETTVKPDCLKEEKAKNDSREEWWKKFLELAPLEKFKKNTEAKIKNYEKLIEQTPDKIKEIEKEQKTFEAEKTALEEKYKKNCYFPLNLTLFYCMYNASQLRTLEVKILSNDTKKKELEGGISKMNGEIENDTENLKIIQPEIDKLSREDKSLFLLYTNAEKAWKKCTGVFGLNFNLKLNLSCKQVKQKIKKVNQKIISLNRKSLVLKYGINSLPILKINKKLSDENIKITKELIVKLDKLNPIIFISKKLKSKKFNNITPDSSIYAIYKKAKDDLASYQTEGKALEAKIKNLKEKTIKDKKIRLEAKFSKLIKKLKTC